MPNGRPALPSCMSLTKPPPAASASPASSPIASMSVLRISPPSCNRSAMCCTPYSWRRRTQHLATVVRQMAVRPAATDALRLARRRFLAPERVDMSALAEELGVNRVTLYRWVGSRDQLLVEVVWSLAREALDAVEAEVGGH